ncbi:MAG: hypothetical protein JWM33_2538 [Caulobacteraceae bacterium]|nr:hypothetical protein [Caulobacteraceae bacterium]
MPLIAPSLDYPALLGIDLPSDLGAVEDTRPVPYGPAGLCYWNCDAYVAEHGGRVAHGWQVLLWPRLYVMLLHHAVVETAAGELIDVTDCPAPHGELLAFIRDDSLVPPRDYPSYIPNRYLPLGASPCATAMAAASAAQLDVLRRIAQIARDQGVAFDLATGPKLRMTSEVAELYRAFDQAARGVTAAELLCRKESEERAPEAG